VLSFEKFMAEEFGELSEKLITFAKQAYPKFGNILILAGGAGSGKGFIKDTLVGMEGFTFDVDALKTLAAKTPMIVKKVKDELGVDLTALAGDLKNPDNVGKLHGIIGDYLGLDDKKTQALYGSILTAAPDRKPNIIFDVTLKDLQKLEKITRQVKELGYDPKKIHIVWVVNDIEVAMKQNAERDRVVPLEILISTHRGASQTMLDIIRMGEKVKKYMDGDIVFAFNKVGVDADLAKGTVFGPNPSIDGKAMGPTKTGRKIGMSGNTKGGSFIKKADYVYIKRSGQQVMNMDAIGNDIRNKISSYVPKNASWS